MEDVNLFRMSAHTIEIEQLFDRKTREYYVVVKHIPMNENNEDPIEDRVIRDRRG